MCTRPATDVAIRYDRDNLTARNIIGTEETVTYIPNTIDLGDDPDGDCDGYDGGYGPVGCTCAPWWNGGRKPECPAHQQCSRCKRVGQIDADSSWCNDCLWSPTT